jgi:hypothetical protein
VTGRVDPVEPGGGILAGPAFLQFAPAEHGAFWSRIDRKRSSSLRLFPAIRHRTRGWPWSWWPVSLVTAPRDQEAAARFHYHISPVQSGEIGLRCDRGGHAVRGAKKQRGSVRHAGGNPERLCSKLRSIIMLRGKREHGRLSAGSA